MYILDEYIVSILCSNNILRQAFVGKTKKRKYFPNTTNHTPLKHPPRNQDLLNFDDPLNGDAADQYLRDKKEFHKKVREYIAQYARR